MKNRIGIVLLFSILIKGIGAVAEVVIQWLITQKLGMSGYGEYAFFINCADIIFWCLFSGIIKCNTFYLSDKSKSITEFKKRYCIFFMFPVLILGFCGCYFLGDVNYYFVIFILVTQFQVNDGSSTYMARGAYHIALVGEYVVGRIVLLLGIMIADYFHYISIQSLLFLYVVQYVIIIVYFFLFQSKNRGEYTETPVSIKKYMNYQQSDVIVGLIGQAPVILQYVFVGAFETGFTGIVAVVKKLVNFISGPTAKVFLPEFSKLYKKKEYEMLRYNYQLIMRIQMLFINVLGILLLGNTKMILSVFSPELLQYIGLFRIVSMVFLFAATLGPTTGLMQMTGNEAMDNKIRWGSVCIMVFIWILLRENTMFALIGMTVQVALEGILKYIYVCIWFKKMPISPIRYLSMWLPLVISWVLVNVVNPASTVLKLLLSCVCVLIFSCAVELTDKQMRRRVWNMISGK